MYIDDLYNIAPDHLSQRGPTIYDPIDEHSEYI